MAARIWLVWGALNAIAALGAAARFFHATEGEAAIGLRYVFEIASNTHMFHALALIAVGLMTAIYGPRLLLTLAGLAFTAGIVLFSGGIYASFGAGAENLRPLIPVGGLSLFAGWVLVALAALTLGKPRPPA